MHLQRLEAVGIVSGTLELSKEGKAMKYFEVEPFDLHLTPQRIAEVVATDTMASPRRGQDEL
jgi:ArsR family transcriptional regulator